MNVKSVSMQNIANALGISKNAVSLALNGKPGVSAALREKVLAEASRLDYFRTSAVRTRNNNLLLMIDDGRDNDSEFFFPIISAAIRHAKIRGYNILVSGVHSSAQEHPAIPRIYYDIKAEGVLFTGNIRKPFIQMFLDAGIPCALMVQHIYGLATDTVVSANEDGGYVLTRLLLELGHRRIGYLADISLFDSFSRRLVGYRKALQEAGIAAGPYECAFSATGEKPSEKTIGPQMDRIMGFADQPTAWVCGNDHTAMALINEFRRRGIRVPEDVSVVGFDAIPSAAIFNPNLTTYDAKIDQIARHAVDLLITHINKAAEGWVPVIVSVMGELVHGESVHPIEAT